MLARHLLLHLLFHFLRRGFSHVRGNHPGVAVGIDNGSTTVPPKHIHHWSLKGCPELHSLRDYFVHVFRQQIQAARRSANCFRATRTHLRHFWPQHDCHTSKRELGVSCFAVWAVHDSPF